MEVITFGTLEFHEDNEGILKVRK